VWVLFEEMAGLGFLTVGGFTSNGVAPRAARAAIRADPAWMSAPHRVEVFGDDAGRVMDDRRVRCPGVQGRGSQPTRSGPAMKKLHAGPLTKTRAPLTPAACAA
jgi:hypothetical protein